LLITIKQSDSYVIAVANEVGLSVIQENALARRFVELAGKVNQMFAASCDIAYFCVAGLQLRLK